MDSQDAGDLETAAFIRKEREEYEGPERDWIAHIRRRLDEWAGQRGNYRG